MLLRQSTVARTWRRILGKGDPQIMDYSLYHAVNQFVLHHAWLGRGFATFEGLAVPLLAAATVALWLLARPGASRKWKLAAANALGSSALALIINMIIGHAWFRLRPFLAHPSAHLWGSITHDTSFPSDHASAAFAIAFAVLFFDRVAGSIFLAAAVVIGFGRVIIGEHYPTDVLAGILVGLVSAVLVVKLARRPLEWLVRLVERLTDPVVTSVRRWAHVG